MHEATINYTPRNYVQFGEPPLTHIPNYNMHRRNRKTMGMTGKQYRKWLKKNKRARKNNVNI